MRCKHEWKLISETTTESKFEHAMKQSQGSRRIKMPHQMCDADRKHIQTFTCQKCGKLKRFVEDI